MPKILNDRSIFYSVEIDQLKFAISITDWIKYIFSPMRVAAKLLFLSDTVRGPPLSPVACFVLLFSSSVQYIYFCDTNTYKEKY